MQQDHQKNTTERRKKMKTRKKYLIIGAAVLFIMFFAGFGLLIAGGPGKFYDRGFHPGFCGKNFKDRILTHMDSRVESLELSEVQKKKYGEIRAKVEANLSKGAEKRRKMIDALKREINLENPDMNAIADMARGHLKNIPDRMGSGLDLFMEFYNILNDDQKTRVIEKFREKIGKHKS